MTKEAIDIFLLVVPVLRQSRLRAIPRAIHLPVSLVLGRYPDIAIAVHESGAEKPLQTVLFHYGNAESTAVREHANMKGCE